MSKKDIFLKYDQKKEEERMETTRKTGKTMQVLEWKPRRVVNIFLLLRE